MGPGSPGKSGAKTATIGLTSPLAGYASLGLDFPIHRMKLPDEMNPALFPKPWSSVYLGLSQ